MSPASIGTGNAYKCLTQGGIGVENFVKVHNHTKFPWDALALILIQITIISYMVTAHGILTAISCWVAYLFGNGLLFVTFS